MPDYTLSTFGIYLIGREAKEDERETLINIESGNVLDVL